MYHTSIWLTKQNKNRKIKTKQNISVLRGELKQWKYQFTVKSTDFYRKIQISCRECLCEMNPWSINVNYVWVLRMQNFNRSCNYVWRRNFANERVGGVGGDDGRHSTPLLHGWKLINTVCFRTVIPLPSRVCVKNYVLWTKNHNNCLGKPAVQKVPFFAVATVHGRIFLCPLMGSRNGVFFVEIIIHVLTSKYDVYFSILYNIRTHSPFFAYKSDSVLLRRFRFAMNLCMNAIRYQIVVLVRLFIHLFVVFSMCVIFNVQLRQHQNSQALGEC